MQLSIISVALGVVIAIACAYLGRGLALQKGRNVLRWTLLCLVLTVVALPVLVLLPETSRGADGDAPPGGDGTSGEGSDDPS